MLKSYTGKIYTAKDLAARASELGKLAEEVDAFVGAAPGWWNAVISGKASLRVDRAAALAEVLQVEPSQLAFSILTRGNAQLLDALHQAGLLDPLATYLLEGRAGEASYTGGQPTKLVCEYLKQHPRDVSMFTASAQLRIDERRAFHLLSCLLSDGIIDTGQCDSCGAVRHRLTEQGQEFVAANAIASGTKLSPADRQRLTASAVTHVLRATDLNDFPFRLKRLDLIDGEEALWNPGLVHVVAEFEDLRSVVNDSKWTAAELAALHMAGFSVPVEREADAALFLLNRYLAQLNTDERICIAVNGDWPEIPA